MHHDMYCIVNPLPIPTPALNRWWFLNHSKQFSYQFVLVLLHSILNLPFKQVQLHKVPFSECLALLVRQGFERFWHPGFLLLENILPVTLTSSVDDVIQLINIPAWVLEHVPVGYVKATLQAHFWNHESSLNLLDDGFTSPEGRAISWHALLWSAPLNRGRGGT